MEHAAIAYAMTGKSTRRSKCQSIVYPDSLTGRRCRDNGIYQPTRERQPTHKGRVAVCEAYPAASLHTEIRAIVQTFVTLAEAMVGVRQLHRNSK